MSTLLTISTRELAVQDPNIDPSDFSVSFNPPINLGSVNYEVCLHKLWCWNTVRNISSTRSISFTIDATPYTLTLSPGLYGIEDINNFLQSDVVANGGTIDELSIVPNYSTNRVRIEISNVSHTYTVDLTAANNLADFFGFSTPSIIASTTEGDTNPQVNGGTDSFYLQCDLQRNSFNNGKISHVLYAFVPAYSPSSQIIEQPVNLTYFQVNKNTIDQIRFKFTNNNGDTIDFEGEHVVIQLHIRPISK